MTNGQCTNTWHRNPGAILACPRCNMTKSEWQELNNVHQAMRGGQPQQESPAGPPVRVIMHGFESDKPEEAIKLANEFFAHLVNEQRARVVNTETHFSPQGKFVVIAAVALFL